MEYQEMNKNGKVVESYSKPQSELTSDCWIVQFKGLGACKTCAMYCKPNCGGGATLLNMLALYMKERGSDPRREFSAMEGNNIHIAMKQGLTIFKMLSQKKKFWRLKKVYQKYVEIAYQSFLDKENPNERLDDFFSYTKMKNNLSFKLCERKGYHQCQACNCKFTTKKGAYRDEVYTDGNGKVIHYYHQHCIMVVNDQKRTIVLDNCGWKTVTTKERLNKYLNEFDYLIFSHRGKWYVSNNKDWQDKRDWKKAKEFVNGMVLKY